MKKNNYDPKIIANNFPEKALIQSSNLFPVVGIGASAGGLDAFKKLLKSIPENSGMAYVLVQHLDPKHESLLPELLQKVTAIPVIEITDDIKVCPNNIYVIPSNKMMVATDGVLQLVARPEKSNTERNLPIDLFFTSLAEVHQSHAIGVVLSGTASDGTLGLKAIKEHGGITFAQDEATAEYEGMPRSAVQAGVVDFILPPDEIPKKLLEVISKTAISDEELQNIPKQEEDTFKQILSLLRIRKGVDFTHYKQTTIRRRILRRMVVNKKEATEDYLKFLRGNNQEQDLLYQDMLIPVTSFFRDKKTFEHLLNHVFPTIIKNKIPGEITRIWVAGCSTGQEAYSFAISIKEFLADDHERIQIFGTDLSEPAITKARAGVYEKSEVEGVSPQQLKEYFTKNNGGYQINKSIRDMCVFAHHNFLKDPPFGKMDCISCRNVLIYMEPYLQKKALTTFHYALKPKRFLLLGKSETTGGVSDLFAAVEKNDKLYTRKDVPGRFMQVASQRSEQILNRPFDYSKSDPDKLVRTDFQKTADEILLSKYTPAGVVVNETMDIVHFRGNTANYLEQAPGKPSHNLLLMAKHGLGFELRNILHKAKTDKLSVVKENIPLSVQGKLRHIGIEAIPLPNTLEPYYLILFHDTNFNDTEEALINNKKKVSAKIKKDEKDIKIQLLEQELAQAREDMRSITEDQEASNEELQSANEELLSGSEELQSLNEELETSKEELQSTNEELTVLNHELISLNDQVTDARNYAESIVATLYQPLLVLDKHLRVKNANKAFYKKFQVNEQETEGLLIYDLGNRQWNIPQLRILLEEILPQKKQITDFEVTHNFLSIGERIIVLNALEITREKKEEKLILLAIEDVTEVRKKASELLTIEKKYLSRFQNLMMKTPVPIVVFRGNNYTVELANNLAVGIVVKEEGFIGKPLFEIMPEVEEKLKPILDTVMQSGIAFYENEVAITIFKEGKNETRFFNTVYEPIKEKDESISGIISAAYDITEQVLARKKMEESEAKLRSLIEAAPIGIGLFIGSNLVIENPNQEFIDIVGKGPDIVGKPLIEVMPELIEHGQPYLKILNDVFTTGKMYQSLGDAVNIVRKGVMHHGFYNIYYVPLFDAAGKVYGIMDIATDVTEQVNNRKKLEESETFSRSVLNNSPDCIKILDAEGRVQFMNDNGICVMEIDDFSKVKNNYWWDLWEEKNQPAIKDAVTKALSGERTQFQRMSNTAKGKPKWWDVIVAPILNDSTNKKVQRIISVSRDITEQKQNELKEKELLERFQNLVVQAPVAICVMRGKNYVIEVINKKMYEMWDRTLEQALNKPAFEVLPELMEQGYKELLDTVYQTGEHFVADELPISLRRNGRLENAFVKFVYEPLRDADGTISGVMAIAHEITEQVLSRKKIEESEIKFRNLIEDAPVATCFFTGREMKIEVANNKILTYWGKGKNVIGKKLEDAVPELKGQPFFKILDKVFTTGKIHEAKNELAQLEVNGVLGSYYFDYTYKPVRNIAGEVYGIINMAVDVTEQMFALKRIEESESRFRKMADLMPQKVWTADMDGNYNYFNKCWFDYSGFEYDDLKNWGWKKVIHPEDLEETISRWQHSITTGVNFEMEHRFINTEGIYKWHLSRGLLQKDEYGNRKIWIGTNTEMHHIKEEEQRKGDFIKMVSHELKTPVTSIKGYVQILLMMLDDEEKTVSATQIKSSLVRIDKQILNLTRLILEMLDLSRIETGNLQLKMETFNLNDLIEEIKGDILVTQPKYIIDLHHDFSASIFADRDRIGQVLINFINNGIKYSPKSNQIEIRIYKTEKDKVSVSVKDFGIGISKEDQQKIFERFYRVGGKNEQTFPGFGIGLFIANSIIEKHKGTIVINSETDKGSEFIFIVDIAPESIL